MAGAAGDTCPPGPRLAGALDRVPGADRRCAGASDDELTGILSRWAAAGKAGVLAELLRRRALPGRQEQGGGLPGAWDQTTGHEVAAAPPAATMGVQPAPVAVRTRARVAGSATRLDRAPDRKPGMPGRSWRPA